MRKGGERKEREESQETKGKRVFGKHYDLFDSNVQRFIGGRKASIHLEPHHHLSSNTKERMQACLYASMITPVILGNK
jgi:hypothetical protein